jgi:hypothetical protein
MRAAIVKWGHDGVRGPAPSGASHSHAIGQWIGSGEPLL